MMKGQIKNLLGQLNFANSISIHGHILKEEIETNIIKF
jgi:hypothetical protein